jgi:hypothetical protein
MSLPIIYVAGPFYDEDPFVVEQNILYAQQVGAIINHTGLAVALVPHSLSQRIGHTLKEEVWAEFTLKMMVFASQATVFTRFVGPTGRWSHGTSNENTVCLKLKRPSFEYDYKRDGDYQRLRKWIKMLPGWEDLSD